MNTLFYFKETKTKVYFKTNDVIYITSKNIADDNIEVINYNTLQPQQLDVINSDLNWILLGSFDTPADAYKMYVILENKRREEGKKANELFKLKSSNELASKWDAIKHLDPIPATIENIETILYILNSVNWGLWNLPRLSISYSAAQHDCDGRIVTTIKLDKKVNGESKYKTRTAGARYLMQYQAL